MERKEIKKLAIETLKKEIAKYGEDRTYVDVVSPLVHGRTRWTLKDALEAAERDTGLPEMLGINPVSDFEAFINYCAERGTDWRDYIE